MRAMAWSCAFRCAFSAALPRFSSSSSSLVRHHTPSRLFSSSSTSALSSSPSDSSSPSSPPDSPPLPPPRKYYRQYPQQHPTHPDIELASRAAHLSATTTAEAELPLPWTPKLPASVFKRYPRDMVRSPIQSRAKRGLFAGRHIKFGNSVSHSHRKTRRTWSPNVQTALLYSDLLKKDVELSVTTHALRCIDKMGGLDAYLLHSPLHKIQGSEKALELRQILQPLYQPTRNRMEMEARLARKGIAIVPRASTAGAGAGNIAL